MKHSVSHYIILKNYVMLFLSIVLGLVYSASSAGETLAVKALNYAPEPLTLPAYTAFMSNQMWLFMIPICLYIRWSYTGHDYIHHYVNGGILLFLITILRNISVNVMPGSVFSLLISTSILFNMGISWFWLKKKFNYWHMGAAACCIASAGCIAITAFLTTSEGSVNFALGIPTAIGSAFFIAVMSVWQEKIQAEFDDVNQRLVEMAIISSMIASILILGYAEASRELSTWGRELGKATTDSAGMGLIVGVTIALPVLKLLVRNSKYIIIQNSNAFFFEFVQASSALLSSLASIVLFGEPWGHGYIASLILMALSFALYSRAKYCVKRPEIVVEPMVVVNPLNVSVWR